MVLTAYFVLSPVIGLVCHRHLRIWRVKTRLGLRTSTNLTPASRRQNHTTSPSALASFVSAPFVRSRALSTRPAIPWHRLTLPRPPHPAPTFVTMANAPARGRDGEGYRSDLGKGGTEIFLQAGLDRKFTDLPGGR